MSVFVGRRVERAAIEELLDRARAGRSGALVVRGEAGIGKTELMAQARETAVSSGFEVKSAVGVEAEAQFAFAGLHQLCSPLLDNLAVLPAPQRAALDVAFGRQAGPAPDRFLVGLATLTLVAEAAESGPLLLLVDDAQWLDEASAQVLAFVARRVTADRVALVFGVRDSGAVAGSPLAGLPELRLTGLDEADALTLLASAVRAPLDRRVRDQLVAEARGNPLALLELPGHASSADWAGGFELPDVLSVPRRVEDGFGRRVAGLPVETQLLVLVAAADPTGEGVLLWRAASTLGIAPESVVPAEEAGLVEVGTRVRFRHPLVRSAVYHAASLPDRRRVHGALAAATDERSEPDRRAWHRARAVLGTDEEVAADLENTAGRARARGGLAAAAAFLQQAVELTPDPLDRARRALDAAHAKHAAGATETARELLEVAASGELDALQTARVELLRARMTFDTARSAEVPRMLLDAARTLAPLDPTLARDTYLDALDASLVTGGNEVTRVATVARQAAPVVSPPRPADLLVDGLATIFTEGYVMGLPSLRLALSALRDEMDAASGTGSRGDRWLWLAGRCSVGILDDELVHAFASRGAQLARETGDLATLPAALSFLASALTLSGDLARAEELAVESTEIAQATGAASLRHGLVMLTAWRGDRSGTERLAGITSGDVANPDGGGEVAVAQYAVAVLNNGFGHYAAAEGAAVRACETDELGLASVGLPELVEAAARAGHPEVAEEAFRRFSPRALACDTSWALGLEARSRALTSSGSVAQEHYAKAVDLLGRSRMTGETARAHLVYGEWLRREGRRQDARVQLRTAHELLSDMGAEAFAERAARELRATGERPRKRSVQSADALTAQEQHIARLVASGATSREVAAQLFLSPRTIEAHLRSIFRKLGITSRRQLKDVPLS